MKYFTAIVISSFLLLSSCNKNTQNKNFTLEGNIKGFTKGTIYLKKMQDTTFIAVDSFHVRDNGKFILADNLDSPEIYYLKIKEIPTDSILVFGEKSVVQLKSQLDKLMLETVITGSTNHDLLMEHKKMISQFKDSQLDMFKANFEASKSQNQKALDSLDKLYKNSIKRQYLYSTNFAVNHADKEVAPYIALTTLYNANISLLDTINNALTSDIKKSKYGKQLDHFITVIKKNEAIK